MAMTVSEASKLSNDVLLEGIVETITKESPILQMLPFIEIVGNGLTYNRESALPTIDFYDVGDPWVESTPTFSQITASLKIMGGDADVDNFLKATRSNVQDLEAAVIELKAKALRHEFEDKFIYGNSATAAKQFDGIAKLIDIYTASVYVRPCTGVATGGTLTLSEIDVLIDMVKGGKPGMILCSKRTRRKINDLIRTSGGLAVPTKDAFGNWAQDWNGVSIYTSEAILDTHETSASVDTAGMDSTDSVAFAFQMGEGALAGLTAPGHITVESIGSLETKDASRTRVKWYVSLALFSQIKAAALIGIANA